MRISLANEVAREGDWFFFFRRADLDKLYPSEPKRRRSKPKRRKPSRAQALIGQLADEVAQLPPAELSAETEPPVPESKRREEPPIYSLIRQTAAKEFKGGYEHVSTSKILAKVGEKLGITSRYQIERAIGRRKS
jgi:hypothetical protein